MASSPAFSSTPRIGIATIATANTNRDGSGTIVEVLAGVAAGTKVTSIKAEPEVTTTAGMVRVYLSTDSGSTWNLFDELAISAATVSASVKVAAVTHTYTDLVLGATTHRIGVATHNAESINVFAFGGDLT
jgi:hypothetical protein